MKTFKLQANLSIKITTTVEAETLEEAIEKSQIRSIDRKNTMMKNQASYLWVRDDKDIEPIKHLN